MHELIPECESKIGAYMCLNNFDKLTHNERFLFCVNTANTGKKPTKKRNKNEYMILNLKSVFFGTFVIVVKV